MKKAWELSVLCHADVSVGKRVGEEFWNGMARLIIDGFFCFFFFFSFRKMFLDLNDHLLTTREII